MAQVTIGMLIEQPEEDVDQHNPEELDVQRLSDSELQEQLILYGAEPGPILPSTRTLYENKLLQLIDQSTQACCGKLDESGHLDQGSENEDQKEQGLMMRVPGYLEQHLSSHNPSRKRPEKEDEQSPAQKAIETFKVEKEKFVLEKENYRARVAQEETSRSLIPMPVRIAIFAIFVFVLFVYVTMETDPNNPLINFILRRG
ncbi:LEM domain-containing protein 1 [Apteryx rowi]|uniref:LEM domain-containing protein 1 n=1 Tax=Apteryx rowi TaxID=308060 RepID=UPI000E1DDDF9|nr:LEM domain-containing protein 1 [Apteryx rowi]